MAKNHQKKRGSHPPLTETPQAEGATVAWLVSVMMVTLLDVAALGMHLYIAISGATEQRSLLASYAIHTAAATGFVSLLLALAAFKLREEKPPPRVTTFSIAMAAAPIVVLVVVSLAA